MIHKGEISTPCCTPQDEPETERDSVGTTEEYTDQRGD